MSSWSGWDWISYGCLGFAALGLAFGAWLKEYPEVANGLQSFSSPKWGAIPAILFAVATAIFLVRLFVAPASPPVPSPKTENHARATIQILHLGTDHTVMQRFNLSHDPVAYELADGKWLFEFVPDTHFDPIHAEVSINGQRLPGKPGNWMVGLFWNDLVTLVFDRGKIKDGMTVDFLIYGKGYKGP